MKRAGVTVIAGLLTACAPAGKDYAPAPAAGYATPQAEFEILKRRLIRTAAGLMRANASLCPATRMITTPDETFPICTNKVAIEDSAIANAVTNGDTILVTTAMIARLSDDELAFLIAHELAHSVEEDYVETAGRPELELTADRTGVFLMARAGYDINAAVTALEALDIPNAPRTDTHPAGDVRMANLQKAIAEVSRRQALGRLLIP